MPLTQAQKRSQRRKGRAAAYFRRAILASKRRKGVQTKVTLKLASLESSQDVSSLLSQAVQAYKDDARIIAIKEDTFALTKAYGEFDTAARSQAFNQILDITQDKLEMIGMISDLNRGATELKEDLVSAMNEQRESIAKTLVEAGATMTKQTVASIAATLAAEQELSAALLAQTQIAAKAAKDGNAEALARANAKLAEIQGSLDKAKEKLQQEIKEKFDTIEKKALAISAKLDDLSKLLASIPKSVTEVANAINDAFNFLNELDPSLFNKQEVQWLYYCKGCGGIWPPGDPICPTETSRKLFQYAGRTEIFPIFNGSQFKRCLSEKYGTNWVTVEGPCFTEDQTYFPEGSVQSNLLKQTGDTNGVKSKELKEAQRGLMKDIREKNALIPCKITDLGKSYGFKTGFKLMWNGSNEGPTGNGRGPEEMNAAIAGVVAACVKPQVDEIKQKVDKLMKKS